MQPLQIVPADGATDGVQFASVGDKPSQGLAVGGESCFQISDGEHLGGCRHEQEDQQVLTFGLSLSFRLLPGSLMQRGRSLVMAEQDLLLFLDKVAQLQKLVNCLDTDQERTALGRTLHGQRHSLCGQHLPRASAGSRP